MVGHGVRLPRLLVVPDRRPRRKDLRYLFDVFQESLTGERSRHSIRVDDDRYGCGNYRARRPELTAWARLERRDLDRDTARKNVAGQNVANKNASKQERTPQRERRRVP